MTTATLQDALLAADRPAPGLLGLAEHLIARLAARGGDAVLQRLADIETRLQADGAYWREPTRRRGVAP